jgi:hypothetical protein
MPNVSLIKSYTKKFKHTKIQYFGSIVWLLPFLSNIFSDKKLVLLSNFIDKVFKIKKSAFKFTMLAIKNEK